MQAIRQMNTAVKNRELFRRPQQKSTENNHKIYPDLRRLAGHGVYSRRQGREATNLRNRGITRLYVTHRVQHDGRSIPTIANYPIIGNNIIETVNHTKAEQSIDQGRVWINKTQYFQDIPLEVWNFCLGGVHICQKWLKDREGRCLSYWDIRQYQRIVMALKEIKDLMGGIDVIL